jgi:hypothetical protein
MQRVLTSQTRAPIERAFGVDFSNVRIHDDHASRTHADALNAKAFVAGGAIHWGGSAPPLTSPAAAPLLAHELTHVVQQQRASSIEDRVSSRGEASELAADSASRLALWGQSVPTAGGSSVPAIQRAPKDDMRSDPADKDIEIEMITAFLQKVATTKPPQDLKTAQVVRNALKMLAGQSLFDVDKFVEASNTPSDPDGMARAFAALLPPLKGADLKKLSSMPFIDPSSIGDRASKLGKKYKPGSPDRPIEVPGDVPPDKQADDMAKRMGGNPPSIHNLDVLGAWRVIQGLGGVVHPKDTKPAAPQANVDEAVAAVVRSVAKDALLPAEAKGGGGDWVDDAQTFALELAKQMDLAQSGADHEAVLTLPASYDGIKDKGAIISAIQTIVQKLRDARPDHASNVKVTVYVGRGRRIFFVGMP